MTSGLKVYLQNDLDELQSSVLKEFKADYHLSSKWVVLNNNVFNHIGPMLLLIFSKYHPNAAKSYLLAKAVYFILLGHDLHQQQNSSTLNILFGDYFYTKFFTYLCEHELLHWADEFANIICQLQEAAIIKSHTNSNNLTTTKLEELADKEYANISELCCNIAGSLRHFDDNTIVTLKQFGKNLGRSVYLSDLARNYNLAIDYLRQANKDLTSLNVLEFQNIMSSLLSQFESKIAKQKIELAV